METLNDKILGIIYDKVDINHGEIFGVEVAAQEIQKLILQEKIDLFKEAEQLMDRFYKVNNSDMGLDVDYSEWKEKNSELTQQLKQL